MKVADHKAYRKFLEKCDSNHAVLVKSYPHLRYFVLVQNGGQSERFPISPDNDFVVCIENFVSNLESAESITVEIENQDTVMQAIIYSFNPPKQATNMPIGADVNSLLGSLPQAQQLLGTVMELNSRVERQTLEADYKQQIQKMEFEKMLLKSELDRDRRELERQRNDFEVEKKRFASKLKTCKTQIANYESEDRALGNINLAKGVAKEAASFYLMMQAANTDNDKKEEKYMALAGLMTGAGVLPEKQAEAGESYVSQNHDDRRKQAQIALFAFLDSIDNANFNHANKLIEYVTDIKNKKDIETYILPLIN